MALAELLVRENARRGEAFGIGVSSDPGWTILLDLFVQQARGRLVGITAACAVSGAPPSTASRYLGELEAAGRVVRRADPHDRRLVLLSLSPATRDALVGYLSDLNERWCRASLLSGAR